MVAGDGDASLIGVSFLGVDFVDNIAVADFFEMIWWNVSKVDDMEGISVINWMCCRIFATETLAETSEFFGIGGAPELLIFWMLDELLIFKGFTHFMVENGSHNAGSGC